MAAKPATVRTSSTGWRIGYGVYPQFPGEEDPEGSIRMGLLAALIPAAADFTLGGAYEYPSRIDFGPRSAERREPFAQQPEPVSGIVPAGGIPPCHHRLTPARKGQQDMTQRPPVE